MKEVKEYYLHYIGQIYSNDRFEKEARSIGVQRAIPFFILRNLSWNQPILLGRWIGANKSAEVFGYFTVNSVVSGMNHELMEKFLPRVKVVSVEYDRKPERRVCGNYTVGLSAIVDEELENLAEKIEIFLNENGVDPNKSKWFVRGNYYRLPHMVLLTPANFTRGYMKVEIKDLDISGEIANKGQLIWIFDYERKFYLKKQDYDAINNRSLKDYV